MKLRVISKDAYDNWFRSFTTKTSYERGKVTSWINVERMLCSPFSDKYKVIDVQPSTTIKHIIKKLFGKEPVTISEPKVSNGFEYMIITECNIYCLQCQSKALDPDKEISDYFIEENDTLLFDKYTYTRPASVFYCAIPIRDFTDFSKIILSQQDIEEELQLTHESFKFRFNPITSVLLYTDEDTEISKYIRYSFASLDAMTGQHLNIYTIEQPSQVKGISARIYWKTYLEERVFSIFQFVGWTRYKPYNKSDAYRIAEMLGLYPDSLPCIVIFANITSDEKIVIPITADYPEFFRTFSSIVLRTSNELNMSERFFSFSDFKELFLSKWDNFMETQSKKLTENFTFNGNTVFINKPKGPFEISDFQKDS